MKLSGYYKELGNDVELKLDYEDLQLYDKVFISKVFTDTPIDESVLNLPNVEYEMPEDFTLVYEQTKKMCLQSQSKRFVVTEKLYTYEG